MMVDVAACRLVVFSLFGAALPWQQWFDLGWRGVAMVFAVLVLRRIPIVLLLKRPLKLRLPDALYLGWFGPVGVAALFMEVHQDPDNAPSDGPNMMRLEDLKGVLETLVAHDTVCKKTLF